MYKLLHFILLFLNVHSFALSPNELYKKYSPTVVKLNVKEKRNESNGTGFFISNDGLCVTNLHVISDAKQVSFIDRNENELFSEGVIGFDRNNDIAIIKFNTKIPQPLRLNLDQNLEIGNIIYAIGSPLGLTNTLSVGIISGIRKEESMDKDVFIRTIQISANATFGSSGSPVFDTSGSVIGIIAKGISGGGVNMNFAIPVEIINDILKNSNLEPIPYKKARLPKVERFIPVEVRRKENPTYKLPIWISIAISVIFFITVFGSIHFFFGTKKINL